MNYCLFKRGVCEKKGRALSTLDMQTPIQRTIGPRVSLNFKALNTGIQFVKSIPQFQVILQWSVFTPRWFLWSEVVKWDRRDLWKAEDTCAPLPGTILSIIHESRLSVTTLGFRLGLQKMGYCAFQLCSVQFAFSRNERESHSHKFLCFVGKFADIFQRATVACRPGVPSHVSSDASRIIKAKMLDETNC